MEAPAIKNPYKNGNPNLELNGSFLLHKGFNSSNQISDIEMIAIQPVTYTSLKDLLPSPPAPAILSPTHNSSWQQIPIKNPLVKHAALAYLQPMSTPPEVGDKGFLWRLKEKCCAQCGCLGWLNEVVFRSLKGTFWEVEDDDDDEDDEEKVD